MCDDGGKRRDDETSDEGERTADERPPANIPSTTKRVGEREDNLRRRGEWFRRRTSERGDQD